MKTISINLYTIDELEGKAKEKAMQWGSNLESEDFDPDFLKNEWTEKLENLGYDKVKLYYSGFYTQGSGGGFEAVGGYNHWLQAHKLSDKYKELNQESENGNVGGFSIVQSGRYYHENSYTLDGGYSDYDSNQPESLLLDQQIDQVDKLIEAERLELSREFYRDMQNEYESVTSDENVTAMLEANEYTFTEAGDFMLSDN